MLLWISGRISTARGQGLEILVGLIGIGIFIMFININFSLSWVFYHKNYYIKGYK
jgi:hypothetical protein